MKVTDKDIKNIIKEVSALADINEIKNELKITDKGVDSLEAMNIYLILEERYSIKIPDADLDGVQSIDDIIKYVNRHI